MTNNKGFIKKTNARLAAVQAVYSYLITGEDMDAVKHAFLTGQTGGFVLIEEDGIKEFFEKLPAYDHDFFSTLIDFFVEHEKQINVSVISSLSENWSEERLETLLKAIMLMGTTELFAFPQTDVKIIMNEYIDIAKSFYDGTEPKMVNAILEKIAKVIRE